MVHADGADSSTEFIDSSVSSHTVTAAGGVHISTASSTFGGASALFDGASGSVVSIPDSSDWDYGSGDMTIDLWVNPTVLGGTQILTAQAITGHYTSLYLNLTGSNVIAYMSSSGAAWDVVSAASLGTVAVGTWSHIAIVRSGTNVYGFLNGQRTVLATDFHGAFYHSSGDPLYIGGDNDTQWFNGYIDEFRVSKGVARWTSDFTPPTRAYNLGNLSPASPIVSSISASTAGMSWVSGGGSETFFTLGRSTDGDTFVPVATITSSTTSYTFSDLSPNTRYYFRVAAGDGIDPLSTYVTSSSIYTDANPGLAPTLSAPTTSTLGLAFVSNGNPTSTTYAIYNVTNSQYIASDGTATATQAFFTTSTWANREVVGLSPNTSYQFLVVSKNANNVLAASSTASVAMYTQANVPSSLVKTASGQAQIALSWTGDASEYYLENTTIGANSGWISSTSYVATDLACGRAYIFDVKGRNGDGIETAPTDPLMVRTSACAVVGGGSGVGLLPPLITTMQSISYDARGNVISTGQSDPLAHSVEGVDLAPKQKQEPSVTPILTVLNQVVHIPFGYKNTTKKTQRIFMTYEISDARGRRVVITHEELLVKPGIQIKREKVQRVTSAWKNGMYRIVLKIKNGKWGKVLKEQVYIFEIKNQNR
jgi:hypothetical protein